ncbi:MAG TPA: hypothetical protein VMJ10_07720 [Kofleriaceae bacterium]|nr:hypothetical protein [Kofleriaceae bacterium]
MTYQDLTFETASLDQLSRVLAIAVELTGYRYLFRTDHEGRGSYYPSWAASYSTHFTHRWQPPDQRTYHYKALCEIRASDQQIGLSTLIATASRDELVAQAIAIARGADRAAFEALTGEGPFAGSDGVVSIGWRLHGGASLNTDLVVSLCHIYHPK